MSLEVISVFLDRINEAKDSILRQEGNLTLTLKKNLTAREMRDLLRLYGLSKDCKRNGYEFGVGRIRSSGTYFLALAKRLTEGITLISEVRQGDSCPRITRCITYRTGNFYPLPLWPITQEELASTMCGHLNDPESLPVLPHQIGSYKSALSRLKKLISKLGGTSL